MISDFRTNNCCKTHDSAREVSRYSCWELLQSEISELEKELAEEKAIITVEGDVAKLHTQICNLKTELTELETCHSAMKKNDEALLEYAILSERESIAKMCADSESFEGSNLAARIRARNPKERE